MTRALLGKALHEARWMLLGCCALLFLFPWLFIWLTSLVQRSAVEQLLISLDINLPVEALMGLTMREALSYRGRVSMAYVDPVVLFISAAWGVSRGSDVVAGELNRGTLEMLLAQPVRRLAVLGTQAAVAVAGSAAIALSALAGTCVGLSLVTLDEVVPPAAYLPAFWNLFALTVCTCGLATLVSSWERYRWRAVGVVSAFYVLQLVVKLMARAAPKLDWMHALTFHSAYLPQVLANRPDDAMQLMVRYNGLLFGVAAAAYLLAAVVFCRRDLPSPL